MTFMAWNPHFVTGLERVDEQHRALIDLVNRAAPGLTRPGRLTAAETEALLGPLFGYAATHFRDEEALMRECGVDGRARAHHEASHADFAGTLARMKREVVEGLPASGERLLSFLASWLVLHILGEDQAMARQVRRIRAGEAGERAFATASGADIAPAPAALAKVLVDVYTTLTRQNRELQEGNRALADQKAAEHAQNERLEDLVAERTRALEAVAQDLARARDAAEGGSRAKSRFLATMSHELRTPLNAILGFSHLLAGAGLEPSQRAIARKVLVASENLAGLVDRVVDYARADEEAPLAPEADLDPRAIVDEVTGSLRHLCAGRGIEVAADIDPAIAPLLRGQGPVLSRILSQFAANAAKFTEHGTIHVRAECLASDAAGRAHLRFSVADSGIGIAPADAERAFQPFQQLDDTTTRRYEGMGLGLALARRLAERIGGQVGVRSEPGRGSTFWLALWLEPAGAGPVEARQEPPPLPAAPAARGAPPAAARQSLLRLAERLAAFDTGAERMLEESRALLRPALGAWYDELSRHVAAFEYEEAARLARRLADGPARPREASP